jgi:hypothetical protein
MLPRILSFLYLTLAFVSSQSLWDHTLSSPPLLCNCLAMAISRILRRMLQNAVTSEVRICWVTLMRNTLSGNRSVYSKSFYWISKLHRMEDNRQRKVQLKLISPDL